MTIYRERPDGTRLRDAEAHLLQFLRGKYDLGGVAVQTRGSWVDLVDIWNGAYLRPWPAIGFLELLQKAGMAEVEYRKGDPLLAERENDSTRAHWRLTPKGYQYASDQEGRPIAPWWRGLGMWVRSLRGATSARA